jgi:hypothetical protein
LLRALAAERGLLRSSTTCTTDQGTLSLLHYLLRHLRGDRVLPSWRTARSSRSRASARPALVEWNRERPRRARGADASLADRRPARDAIRQASVGEEFAMALYGETEGNSLFIEEVVKSPSSRDRSIAR